MEELGVKYDGEFRFIRNDSTYDAPMFCIKSDNLGMLYDTIYTTVENYTFWSQTIYQLSHEFTHCFIYVNNRCSERTAWWIEETICEMMAYYFLKFFYNNWEKCDLGKYQPSYKQKILTYLENELQNEKTKRLSKCSGYEELMEIDKSAQEYRQDRRFEVIEMLEKFSSEDVIGLFKYKDYVESNKRILDTKRYMEDYKANESVKYLCNIQNRILMEKNTNIEVL